MYKCTQTQLKHIQDCSTRDLNAIVGPAWIIDVTLNSGAKTQLLKRKLEDFKSKLQTYKDQTSSVLSGSFRVLLIIHNPTLPKDNSQVEETVTKRKNAGTNFRRNL